MRSIVTLAVKDLRVLSRDKFALFWIFAFPLMYAMFFGFIFGDGDGGTRGKIPVAIVDEDGSEESRRFVDRLAEHASIGVERTPDSSPVLHELADASGLVRRGSKAAFIRIPKGYGDSPFSMFGGGEDDRPKVEIGMDPSRQAEKGFLQGVMMESLFGGMADRFKDKEMMRAEIERTKGELMAADDINSIQKVVLSNFMTALGEFFDSADVDILENGPGSFAAGGQDVVEFVEVARERGKQPRSAFEITFPQSMVWGLMGVAVGFAITLVRERANGTMLRLKTAPITRSQLLVGKALGCFVFCLIVMVFLLVFGYVALKMRFESPLLVLIAMIGTASCFTGVMMAVSVMGKTEQAVAGASWGVMMPFAMIGGGMIPLIAMPEWLQTASHISPFKWGIYSMEGAMWRGFSVAEMMLPFGILVGIGALFFAIGVFVFRKLDG